MSGALFVSDRRRKWIKILVYDGQGFVLSSKETLGGALRLVATRRRATDLRAGRPPTANSPVEWRPAGGEDRAPVGAVSFRRLLKPEGALALAFAFLPLLSSHGLRAPLSRAECYNGGSPVHPRPHRGPSKLKSAGPVNQAVPGLELGSSQWPVAHMVLGG